MNSQKRSNIRVLPMEPAQQLNNMAGKVPPQAVDLEEVVLGALMLEKNALAKVIDRLKPECFYKESHSIIYRACLQLFELSQPVDILTVTQQLKKTGELDLVGGAFAVSQLTNRVASAANIEEHTFIILQMFIKREGIRFGAGIIKDCYDETTDVFDNVDKMQTGLNDLVSGILKKSEKGTSELMKEVMDRLDVVATSDNAVTGVPSLLKKVDEVTGGWQGGDLIIMAARPGMGKTGYLKTVIKATALERKKPVLLFSIEMSAIQIMNRLISEDTGVRAKDFDSKKFLEKTTFKDVSDAGQKYFGPHGEPLLIIEESASLTINELRAKAKLICSKHDIQIIMVDYLQKVSSTGDNRNLEVEKVTWGLKQLAKDLNIPVLALSQLSRAVEGRTSKKPQLSDLRDSGAIEQDADVVGFIYRPEYYDMMELEDGSSSHQVAFIDIAKQRNGSTGEIKVRFIDYLTKFQDWEEPLHWGNASANPYSPSAGMTPSPDFATLPVAIKKRDPFALEEEEPF